MTMHLPTFRLAICGAALLAGCAGKPPPVARPTLVLADYVDGTPQDEACVALGQRAFERGGRNGFKLIGKEMTVVAAPGAAPDPARPGNLQVPLGSYPAGRMERQLDGTFHTLFVNCETRLAYIAKRGGVIDITYWFGPFDL